MWENGERRIWKGSYIREAARECAEGWAFKENHSEITTILGNKLPPHELLKLKHSSRKKVKPMGIIQCLQNGDKNC